MDSGARPAHDHLPFVGALRSEGSNARLERLPLPAVPVAYATSGNDGTAVRLVRLHRGAARNRNPPADVAGRDLGLIHLPRRAMNRRPEILKVPNPAPLRAALAGLRRPGGQKMFPAHPRLKGHGAAKAKSRPPSTADASTCQGRQPPAHHDAGGHLPRSRDEDLDLAAMKRSMGRRSSGARCPTPRSAGSGPSSLQDALERNEPDRAGRLFAFLLEDPSRCGCRLIEAAQARPAARLRRDGYGELV